MSYARRAVEERGGDALASTHLYEWISNHPAFEDVVYREFWIPCSPWIRGSNPESNFWNEVGSIMRDDLKASNLCSAVVRLTIVIISFLQAFLRSGRPLLLGHGLSTEFVDAMERNAYRELDEAVTPVYVLIQNVYARKRH